ncbi:hypothetical protein D3C84_451520 [compost metagenome]
MDQQDGVGTVPLQQGIQRLSVGIDIGIAADVLRRHGQLATALQQHIGGHVGQPTAVGEDGEPLPLEGQGVAEGLDGGKQLMGIPYPQHAGPADGRVVNVVEPVGRIVATALEHQDRLVARGGAGGREEMAGVVQLVHVDQDGAGRPVAGELIQQLAEVDVAVIPEGDEGREADLPLLGPVENGGADRRRLGEEGHLPWGGGDGGEAGVDALPRQEHAHAVGAEQADAVLAAQPLQLMAILGGELGGQYDGGACALLAELLDEWQYPLAPGADDGEIGGQRQAGDIGIGEHAGDGLAVGADRQYGALELTREQVPDHHMTRLLRVGRGADDGNRLGFEEPIQAAWFHGHSSWRPPRRG